MKIAAYIFYGLAALDFIVGWLLWDITGVWWSPIVLAAIGGGLMGLAENQSNQSNQS